VNTHSRPLRPVPRAVAALFACALLPLLAPPGTAAGSTSPADAVTQLHALFDAAWERDLRENPLVATYQGDARYNDRWPDLSSEALEARHRADVVTLAQLGKIPRAALPAAEQLNYDLFAREYEQRLAVWPFKPWLYEINHQGGVQTLSELAEQLPFNSARDYADWLARLRGLGAHIDQHIELLRIAAREDRTQPRVIMERIPPQLAAQIVAQPADSPFYQPFTRMPETIPAAERARLQAAARSAIETVVVPAYRRLQRAFVDEYLPRTRASVGLSDTPQGAAFYRERIAYHTTLSSLTADDIHALGLAEVARIRAEMQAIITQVGFEGDFAAFVNYLRTDPKFFYATEQELLEGYLAVSKRIDPNLTRLFGKLPRTPYGVRAIPRTSAPNTTTAYYQPPSMDGTRPGYYYVNLYRPEVRPKWEMEVLSVHEAVPGHHLQIALAYEQAGLPRFRRFAGYTAYVEGWALYAESLGEELGLYQDPYSKFGQLTYDMWRAVRLVVDTGLHAKGWSREQAIAFFRANAPKTDADIVNEIDRYISWPGQALAYKVGQLRIRELRSDAERTLGERFDLRAFHDELLSTGAVPLDFVDRQMRQWTNARTVGAAPATGTTP
jgi:uncharacterized protein (DUF885 family)